MISCPRCGAALSPRFLPLTKKQSDLLRYLLRYNREYGHAPRFEDIARYFRYRSLATDRRRSAVRRYRMTLFCRGGDRE